MVVARRIILTIFVSAATFFSMMVIRTLSSPTTSTKLFGYFFSIILVLVLLPMLIGYFNGWTRACSLDVAAQIKITRELSLVFICL
jgi:hypothetical protein